jgi:hypothetical protein
VSVECKKIVTFLSIFIRTIQSFDYLIRLDFESGAFVGGNDGESRPALFYIVAAAAWAGHSAFLIVNKSQDLRECFLAGVAEEFVVGHTYSSGTS